MGRGLPHRRARAEPTGRPPGLRQLDRPRRRPWHAHLGRPARVRGRPRPGPADRPGPAGTARLVVAALGDRPGPAPRLLPLAARPVAPWAPGRAEHPEQPLCGPGDAGSTRSRPARSRRAPSSSSRASCPGSPASTCPPSPTTDGPNIEETTDATDSDRGRRRRPAAGRPGPAGRAVPPAQGRPEARAGGVDRGGAGGGDGPHRPDLDAARGPRAVRRCGLPCGDDPG